MISKIEAKCVRSGAARGIDRPPERIGLDENSFLRGYDYITVLTDITGTRVLDIG
jgi:hypothetical protein